MKKEKLNLGNDQKKKIQVLALDFDGPINDPNKPDSVSSVPKGKYLHRSLHRTSTYEKEFIGDCHPYDIFVSNPLELKLTLEVLHRNGIHSVLISQRIHMDPEKENLNKSRMDMYNSLDYVLGKDRKYLTFADGDKIGKKFINATEQTNKSKVIMLKAIEKEFGFPMLCDDSLQYKKPTEEAGYPFIHAPGKPSPTYQSSTYFYDILLKVLHLYKIKNTLIGMKFYGGACLKVAGNTILNSQIDSFYNAVFNHFLDKNVTYHISATESPVIDFTNLPKLSVIKKFEPKKQSKESATEEESSKTTKNCVLQ